MDIFCDFSPLSRSICLSRDIIILSSLTRCHTLFLSLCISPFVEQQQQMEGTCSGRYGFIVCITHIENVSEGIITDDGTARAKFAVEYDCVAYRPFKNEVLDAVVTQVNKFGFFAEAGPLQLFVSNSLVPDDVKYVTDENCYKSDDGQITIGVDCEVRVKIVGMRIDANDIFCIATIKEDYLGLIGYAEGDAAVGAV